MATVIMIASGKGGTGKSTVATYVATELAQKNCRTLLIELDAGLRSIDVISGIDTLRCLTLVMCCRADVTGIKLCRSVPTPIIFLS